MLIGNIVECVLPDRECGNMTLVVALRTDEGIVLASDSQTTNVSDGRVYEDTPKLFVASERVAIGVSGAGALTQPIVDRLLRKATSKADIEDVGKILCEEGQASYQRQSALLHEGRSIPAEFVLAAWATAPNSKTEEPFLYGSAAVNGFDLTRYVYSPIVTLGNTAFCEVLLRRIFDPSESIEEAQLLAVLAILETARVVNNVNDRIQMLVVRRREVETVSQERIGELKVVAQRANWRSLMR